MTAKEMAKALHAEVVEGNFSEYQRILEEAVRKPPRDPYWRNVVAVFQSIPADQKDHFLAVFRQVAVDAVSSVFGILDGTSPLNGQLQKLMLTDSEGKKLNGCLQDHFLTMNEESQHK